MKKSEIPEGQGATGQIDGRDVAVIERDGELVVFENVCTHRRCQLTWNSEERSWDCPCHGSRFTEEGEVIAGPAQTPLQGLDYVVNDGDIELV